MYDKAFITNVNKYPKPFFLEQHIDIDIESRFKAFGRSVFIDFLLTVKGTNLIFRSGRGSVISSAKQGEPGSIYNLVKNK